MRSKDITLTSNVIGLYIAITILTTITPLNVSSVLYSALFGIFWNYLSTKRNLVIQVLRITLNAVVAVLLMPKLILLIKGQSLMGITFLEWFERNSYPIEPAGLKLFYITGSGDPTSALWMFFFIYSGFVCLILPYCFYRYFRWKGIYNRLPSF